ncbi:20172_t:CDS:2, partial [Dentiscutata erythropus]
MFIYSKLEKDINEIKKVLKRLSKSDVSKDNAVSESLGRSTKVIKEKPKNRNELQPMSKQKLISEIDVIISGFDESEASNLEKTWILQKRTFVRNVLPKLMKALKVQFEYTNSEAILDDTAYHSDEISKMDEELYQEKIKQGIRDKKEDKKHYIVKVLDLPWRSNK